MGYGKPLPWHCEIEELFTAFSVVNDCTYRHGHFDARSVVPRAIASFAMASALRGVLGIEPQVKKSVVVLARYQDNIAAGSAIPAARAAARNIFLASEGKAAIAAIASLYHDFSFVNKHENHAPQKAAARRLPLKTIA